MGGIFGSDGVGKGTPAGGDLSGTYPNPVVEKASTDFQVTGAIYLGDPTADGTWKIVVDGNDLSFERRESGTYVYKGGFVA